MTALPGQRMFVYFIIFRLSSDKSLTGVLALSSARIARPGRPGQASVVSWQPRSEHVRDGALSILGVIFTECSLLSTL